MRMLLKRFEKPLFRLCLKSRKFDNNKESTHSKEKYSFRKHQLEKNSSLNSQNSIQMIGLHKGNTQMSK